jgi:hypothetical protein
MADQVPLEHVSERQKQNGRTLFGRRLLIFEINRLHKKEPPGGNLGITLKINKWTLLERNSMQQNDIYNIPLPRGPGSKKKNKKTRNVR